MLPRELCARDFSRYPPQARALALAHLATLRKVPLALLPIILSEVMDYDWRFPVEQRNITRQLDWLAAQSSDSFSALMSGFSGIRLPVAVDKINWVNQPQRFSEQLSALLWSTLQMDTYRAAALHYQTQLQQALAERPPATPRFSIVVIGKDVPLTHHLLFRPLRPHGVLFSAVDPGNGLATLIRFVKERARKYPENYAHWYIDDGKPEPACGSQDGVTQTSYYQLAPVALRELKLTNRFAHQSSKNSTVGPEAVQSYYGVIESGEPGLAGKHQLEPPTVDQKTLGKLVNHDTLDTP